MNGSTRGKPAALVQVGRLLERRETKPGEDDSDQAMELAEKLDTQLLAEELAGLLRLVWAASSEATTDAERADVNSALSVAAEFAEYIAELNGGQQSLARQQAPTLRAM